MRLLERFQHLLHRPRVDDIRARDPAAPGLRDAIFEIGVVARVVRIGIDCEAHAGVDALADVFVL
jgi:hypothetical protein